VTKNIKNILSQLLDKKIKNIWSLGQLRQARGYGAADQDAMLFRLELRCEALRKKSFCIIHLLAGYLMSNLKIRLFFSKLSYFPNG
jgi:hypothetical protein